MPASSNVCCLPHLEPKNLLCLSASDPETLEVSFLDKNDGEKLQFFFSKNSGFNVPGPICPKHIGVPKIAFLNAAVRVEHGGRRDQAYLYIL